MVKKYRRNNGVKILSYIITLAAILCMLCFCILDTILFINNEPFVVDIYQDGEDDIFDLVFGYSLVLFAIYEELSFFFDGGILLNESSITIMFTLAPPWKRIQYPTTIKYKDIVNMIIIPSNADSKGCPYYTLGTIPYLILFDMKGKKYRFSLKDISKKAVRSLLIDLLEMCKKYGDIEFDIEKLMQDYEHACSALEDDEI